VPEDIIVLENISKTFNGYQAVDNLSLTVKEGEIYGFLGPNGSGKSTTLRMMLNLIQPDKGSITINGHDLFKNRHQALNSIGCIIEKPDFYSYLSALENLKIFARMHGVDASTANMMSHLEKVGLQDRANDKLKNYSHGMKQRIGLAQALLHNPKIVILDEPNTGLDPQGIIDLRNTLLKLNREEGKTIILSSHILPEIEDIAQSMILINKGKTIVQGKVADLLSKEQLVICIESDNEQQLKEAIMNSNIQTTIIEVNSHQKQIELSIANDDIPKLMSHLVNNSIPIYNMEKRRNLERLFLKLTHL
jgi:ABC-2 type transport system ATP-binding protein